MVKVFTLRIMGIAATACFLACEQAPQKAVENAHAALEAAKKSGAKKYGPTQLKSGQKLYDSAMKDLSQENRKLPFFRHYRQIIETLENAEMAGKFAFEAVESAKVRIKIESDAMLYLSKQLADSLQEIIKVVRVKNKAINDLQAALDSAIIAREEARGILSSGDLFLGEKKMIFANDKIKEVAENTTNYLAQLKVQGE